MIIFASRTGNVRNIIKKMEVQNREIEPNMIVTEPYILFTYTDGLGAMPKKIDDFLSENYQFCLGVFASGNRNFGVNNFAGAADKIKDKYGIPTLMKVELRSNTREIEEMKEIFNRFFTEQKQAEIEGKEVLIKLN